MINTEYYRTLVVGGIIGASVCILGFYMLKPENPPVTPKTNFAVVDTYKGCKIVQWDNGSSAVYKYFLDCNNK